MVEFLDVGDGNTAHKITHILYKNIHELHNIKVPFNHYQFVSKITIVLLLPEEHFNYNRLLPHWLEMNLSCVCVQNELLYKLTRSSNEGKLELEIILSQHSLKCVWTDHIIIGQWELRKV